MTGPMRRAGRPGGSRAGVVLAVLGLLAVPAGLRAQTLAERIDATRDGKVRLTYATRPGVCGDGRAISVEPFNEDWERVCEPGPARVVLTFRAGVLRDVDTYVGGRWRPADERTTDLGTVSAAEAARYFLGLARRRHRARPDVIFPATVADSAEVWPELLDLARDETIPRETRKRAVFWLGQAAGAAVVRDLTGLVQDDDTDREVREHAVFALSQLRGDVGVPALIDIARHHDDPHIRKTALFWLGQSGDPRAIALFEEILLRR